MWEIQEALRERILAGDETAEHVLFVEHEPVITLGRSADQRHVLLPANDLRARGIEVVSSSRGGDVTYHGPGQLVVYPVVRLRAGVLDHVVTVGTSVASVLAQHGIAAEWRRDPAGVWVKKAKIAACGVHVRQRVAIHGLALNVTIEPLASFACIVPCGLSLGVTSMAVELASEPPPLPELCKSIAETLCRSWSRTPLCSCDRMLAR
ncbi:MAG: lipoyl(octanoyl) transferase LipB [Deltaproteobacteria bacterium]|nr:lipoyl(octanoyl) transferase LipB [Deltaproteobacteria bacterium]